MEVTGPQRCDNAFSCELEDWFHILGSDKVPRIDQWSELPLCAEKNIDRLLELLETNEARGTFFCLGWMAERMPHVVRRCQQAGHEIGSHGYAHVLAYEAGPRGFLEDIARAKKVLEDLTGEEVVGFRAPGFSIKEDNRWVFDVVAEAGYRYDASVFPTSHGHGGLRDVTMSPHREGTLVEIPMSAVSILGHRTCLFGGGYLRLAPLPLIRWGVNQLQRAGRPLIVYIHPREIDPGHPRLPLSLRRRFKCYVNLDSTMPKLKWLCEHYRFTTMKNIAARVMPGVEEKARETETRPVTVPAASRKRESAREHVRSSH